MFVEKIRKKSIYLKHIDNFLPLDFQLLKCIKEKEKIMTSFELKFQKNITPRSIRVSEYFRESGFFTGISGDNGYS